MRLTKKSEKFINAYEWNRELPTKTFIQLGMNKLGQLEDIEEELGIDLFLYFEVMSKRTIFVKGKEPEWGGAGTKKDIASYYVEEFNKDFLVVRYRNSKSYSSHYIENPTKKYGKTWALTKEELL